MAITRQARKARGSSPNARATRVPPSRAATAHNRKGGLTKELVALGVLPTFQKAKEIYQGPGYQSNAPSLGEKSTECAICAEMQDQSQFPETTRHTETQLSGDGKWRHVQCVECEVKLSKAQIGRLVWREDFKRLEEFAKIRADEANPRYRSCLSPTCDTMPATQTPHPSARRRKWSRKWGRSVPGKAVASTSRRAEDAILCIAIDAIRSGTGQP
ncbi:MAG: hypothetical protein Q9184_003094 [Pyrenodesmia sp. 2 TL-2023]